jgi:hypothetical protein
MKTTEDLETGIYVEVHFIALAHRAFEGCCFPGRVEGRYPLLAPWKACAMTNSKKVSTLRWGRITFGGPNKTYAKPIETFFELSIVSAPSRSEEQSCGSR